MKLAAISWWEVTLLITVLGQTNIKMNKVDVDLNLYFNALNKIADFFSIHRYYLNTIAHFGLFVSQVNMKKVLIEEDSRLPASIKIRLNTLVYKMDDLIRTAESIARNNPNPAEAIFVRNILSLFTNETQWMTQMGQFHRKKSRLLTYNYNTEHVKTLYRNWRSYLRSIDPLEGTPTPEQSDACLANLSTINPVNNYHRNKKCNLPSICQKFTISGSNNGYGLTHRLLFLQMARFGRRCHVISKADDKYLRKEFCERCYAEGMYIDFNDFKAFDLFLEQIFLCTLEGHSQFIRHDWLMQILRWQVDEGCFPDVDEEDQETKDTNLNGRFSMLEGRCNGHTTVLAAGVLASAIRFLLENSY
ncbi:uncharacterized protein LOC135309723 [Plodia interpunctella]|uniref:uncharacterized protein LOC135309723 n=1 Tax=Plodia interpunctella TaxID=58824 RepID=UPI0031014EED